MIVRKKGVIARSKQPPLVPTVDEVDNRKEERRERKVRYGSIFYGWLMSATEKEQVMKRYLFWREQWSMYLLLLKGPKS